MAAMNATAAAPQAGRAAIFEARGLTKTYHMGTTEVHALRGVDLGIRAGEFIVLLGPSGSGKSTLLNILGGLDTPTSGAVRFLEHELTAADEAELTRYRRQHVGFVFQFYNLIPSLTARENVALVTEIAERPMAPEEALEWVGLGERLDHFPSQLSGGEAHARERLVGREGIGDDVRDQGHVLARGEARDQVVELEDEADVFAPVTRQLGLARPTQVMVAPLRRPRRRRIEAAEDVEQCRLAAARRPEQDDEL